MWGPDAASARRETTLDMRIINGKYRFSPSDLIRYLGCPFVSWLDRYDKEFPGRLTRDSVSEEDELLQGCGDKHERAYLEELKTSGLSVCDLRFTRSPHATLQAMQEGHAVIYQASLEDGEFDGISDFLFRTPGQSKLGDYLYEVWDTKLARTAKPYHAIQVCCYAEMLESLQGVQASHAGIILGNGKQSRLELSRYKHYYNALKRAFLEMHRTFDPNAPVEIPIRGEFRHWTGYIEKMRKDRDDLTLVAGIRSSQIRRFHDAGITSTESLAEAGLDGVPGIAIATFHRLRDQAKLQSLSKGKRPPLYELIPQDPDQPQLGFGALPPASSNDVYFDMEGYPLIEGGLEYLFGASYLEGDQPCFKDWWAHDQKQEKQAFAGFVRWVHARWKEDPSMHIYHYAAYEKAALQKLMSRYAVCEGALDDLLRNEVFVDLYKVVRQALIVGEPSYSLKNVEKLYLAPRSGQVATASASIVYYQRWIDEPDGDSWETSNTLQLIRDYNREDCDSTLALTRWLRGKQTEACVPYAGDNSEAVKMAPEHVNETAQLVTRMLEEAGQIEDDEQKRIHLLLTHLIEFHHREQKPVWWAYFDRLAMSEQELIEDPECLGGLVSSGAPERVKKSYRYRYSFSPQETKLRDGKKCVVAAAPSIRFEIEYIDFDEGWLTFKRSINLDAPPERISLVPNEIISQKPLSEAIRGVAAEYRVTRSLNSALADFLGRRTPRFQGTSLTGLLQSGVPTQTLAIEAARKMDGTSLVVQGPPGTGKTHTASRMIAELLRDGFRVGVMSNSHRAIALLLGEAATACQIAKVECIAVNVDGDESAEIAGIRRVESVADIAALDSSPNLVGGTAWVFCRPDMTDEYDYLFIDEAGQVSVANLVAVSNCARNLVILGDQCQLNQPTQGVHPGESGASILEYYLGSSPTVDSQQGIFLERTWRMRPELCHFLSEAIYRGRLTPAAVTARRHLDRLNLHLTHVSRTEGVLHIPVKHEDHSYECPEEAEVISEVIDELLRMSFQDETEMISPITVADILVVSPYNLQVLLLQKRLPSGVRVGTVDKFQGQEAAVVIYSMATSSGDTCRRGVDFLFSPNRLNVALSRAKVLAILVASPQLVRTDCRSLEQMQLVNLYCHAVAAGTIHPETAAKSAVSGV
jgi:predicted RecB family nuclease